MQYSELWDEIAKQKRSAASPIHGLGHWRRVLENGLAIAKETGANVELVELFALFHDSCRFNDGKDPEHGNRAAQWVASMRYRFSTLPDDLFQFLLEALRNHTHVKHTHNMHIATCWDADRLDLGRVGKIPNEEFMNTDTGRILARYEIDVEKLVKYIRCKLDLERASLADEYFYQSLPLCVLDAVYSINANYKGTRSTVKRYCDYYNLERLRLDRESLPSRNEQHSISSFIKNIEEYGYDYFAERIVHNRQRTSTKKGILKADAACRFAKTLKEYGVDCFQEMGKVVANENFDSAIRAIPGQAKGIALNYFFMLAGSDKLIKPDRHILAFVKQALGKTVNVSESQILLAKVCKILQLDFPHFTMRLLDSSIWNYQKGQAKNNRGRVSTPVMPVTASAVAKKGGTCMNGNELKDYVQRLIDGHEKRTAPKGKDDLTQAQIDIYEIVKDVYKAPDNENKNNFLESVKDKYFQKRGRPMQLLLSDFCYNLVNVGPDFEAKYLFHTGRGNYEFVDFFADTKSPEQIIWKPKGKNVPKQLAGKQFRVGQYYRGAYKWNFVELLIRNKFLETGSPVMIPLLKRKKNTTHFTATLHQDGIGINVDNLGQYPLLDWRVFDEAVKLMKRLGGMADKGIVMKNGESVRLGNPGLGVNTIEGHVAQVVYGKQIGESVFRRITPIAGILIWAGICKAGRGKLILK